MEWRPHPKQEAALVRSEFEVLFGGARGGGKTDAGLVWLLDGIENPRYRALVIRKNADDLTDWSDRAVRMYHGLGAHIVSRPVDVTFPSGARIVTGHLKDDQAYTKYQGQEYQRILIEELTQIPDEKRYLQLLSSCRSTILDLPAQVFCSTNPGGVGHGWVKKRFVDPSPPGVPFTDPTTGRTRIFIPSLVTDNPTLIDNDPGYIKFLDGLKDTDVELWKAWRLGDWNTFAGQIFREFRTDTHICNPFIPKSDLQFVGGLDWGYSAPAVLLCGVFKQVDWQGIKFNRLFVYREVDGTEKTPEAWSSIYKQVENYEKIRIYADPAVFNKLQDSSFSIASQFNRYGIYLHKSSNNRLSGITTLHNWLSLAPDGLPYMIIAENCVNLIRTLPQATYDEKKIEDVDQGWQEDHWFDALRYLTAMIKWIDAKSGAYGYRDQSILHPKFTLVNEKGQFVPLDPDKFGELPKGNVYYKKD